MITRQLDFFKGARVQPNNIVSVQGHPEGTKAAQRHSIGPSSRAMKVVQHEGRASSALDASLHSLPHTCRGAHVYTYTYMQCMHTYTYTLIISLSLSLILYEQIFGETVWKELRPTSACHGQETSWCIHHLWQWGYRILLNLQYSQFRALPLGPIQDVIPGFCDDDCVDERTLAFRKFMYQNGFEEARHFFGPRYDSLAKWTRELLALLSWSSCLCRAYGMPNIAGCYCTKQGGWRDSSGLPWTRDT